MSQCYASLHCDEYGQIRRGTFTTQVKRNIGIDGRILEQTTDHAK